MQCIRPVSSILFAVVLLTFGSNFFFHFFPMPSGDGSVGSNLIHSMIDHGLIKYISLSHILIGIMLLMPKTRIFGALIQIPISIGIVCFHTSMLPNGLYTALVMLLLNAAILWRSKQILSLFKSLK